MGTAGRWGFGFGVMISAGGVAQAAEPEPSSPATIQPAVKAADPASAAPPKEQAPKEQASKAPPRIPSDRFTYDTLIGARLNPLGLEVAYNLAYRHRLYASDSLALRDNAVSVGISPTVSPANARMGGFIEVKPLSLLTLSAGFHQVGHFGSFNQIQTFACAEEDYSDSALKKGTERNANHPRGGIEANARATALVKLGPIVLRDDVLFTYTNLGLEEERPLYYHIRFDVLAQDKSWFVHNDTDLIYLSDFGLAAGARLSLSHSFIDEANLGDAEDRETLLRLGPLAAYTFFDEPGASFNKPTLLAIAGWWLLHPFRTGDDVSQAVPYVALGFRFEGDLFRSAD